MKIAREKREKISEQILALLYTNFSKPLFTSKIAQELARDEEFIKNLLEELKSKKLIISITKNPKGTLYLKRIRWKLHDSVYQAYKQQQE